MQPNWIAQRKCLTPKRIGLTYGTQQWTFEELGIIAETLAKKLATHQLTTGKRVAILASSTPELIQVIYGCMYAQLEMVFLNKRLTADELAYQINDAAVDCILVDEQHEARIEDKSKVTFSQLFSSPLSNCQLPDTWDPQQTVSIMYTSGTTGFPKGVRQTLANHEASAMGSVLNLGLRETDVWLCTVPIFHISGFSMLMKSILYGIEIKLYEIFDVAAIAEDIATGRITHLSLVGVMLGKLLNEMEGRKLCASQKFETILAGGGPIPVDYLKRAFALNMRVAQTYGMTETSSQSTTLSSEDALRKLGSSGKPLFFNAIRIEGTNEPNVEGEICIRGPHVTPGYIGRFAERQAQQEGWLYSGDIGYLDEEGFLFVVDRRSDLIISGGENIYPAQIENILLAHPQVAEAGVCGIEDAQWGQVPVAFVVKKGEVTVEEIRAYCEKRLARYKVPKAFYFVEQLPRNGSNKLLRRKLPELL